METESGNSIKRSSENDDLVLCCSIFVNEKKALSNRLVRVDARSTWEAILQDFSEELGTCHISADNNNNHDNVECQVSNKLHGSDIFYPKLLESISTVREFDQTLKYVTYKIKTPQTPSIMEQSSTKSEMNAFSILMQSTQQYDKLAPLRATTGPRFTAKDRLYNDIVREMTMKEAFFPNRMTNETLRKNVDIIVNALWYVDGSAEKLLSRCGDISPRRILSTYCGYNDWKKRKQRAPQLSSQDLRRHSTALFGVLMLPFTSGWGDFKNEVEQLAVSLDSYATFLEKANLSQKQRQQLDRPVREVGTHLFLQNITGTKCVDIKYALLDEAVSKCDYYEPLFFDEHIHLPVDRKFKNTFERYEFVHGIQLSSPVDILRYDPGGSLGCTLFLWRLPEERGINEVLNDTLKTVQKLKPRLHEFHTRRMKREFVQRYGGLHAVTIPKHILRAMYAELTGDASSDQNPAIDARVRQAVTSDDPDLVLDLRHENKGRPGDAFEPFFDLLTSKVEEISAADERRHNIEHLSKFVSVRDLIDDVKKDLPDDAKIPSESTVLFSFAPKNAYVSTSRLYTSKIPLQFKVQTRQLRLSHQDDHYCAAQYKYMRTYAKKFKDNVTFLSIDDKSKVDFGEPGQFLSSGVRGKKSIVPSGSTLSAMDHDVGSKGSITPSVCLDVNIPEDDSTSFYQGSVYVTYKDSVFQPSSPWRHAAEIEGILRDKGDVTPILMIFSDGGPDHRVTYHSVKLSLIMLFKHLDLDILIAARTAPGHSWLNPVERIMSTLNIALQNAALARSEGSAEIEQVLRSSNSMAEIRKKAEKVTILKSAWIDSVNPIIEVLQTRTEKMVLKGVPFKTKVAAAYDVIDSMERQVKDEIDPAIEVGHYLQKDLSSKTGYQNFLARHCIQRHYLFQVRKCDEPNCCGPKRGPDVPWLPDPVLGAADSNHYKPLDEVLGQDTTDTDRPSSKNTTVTAVAEELQGVKNSVLTGQNVRKTVDCTECCKPRCIYAKKALTMRQSRAVTRLTEKYDYTCGALIVPEGDVLHGTLFVRLQLNCSTPIEYAYYAANATRKDICCFCAVANAEKDPGLVAKFKVVLPLCASCKSVGKEALKRNPFK